MENYYRVPVVPSDFTGTIESGGTIRPALLGAPDCNTKRIMLLVVIYWFQTWFLFFAAWSIYIYSRTF